MTQRIDDGHPTTVEFSAAPSFLTVQLYEKEVTPPGLDGGGANDTTTMKNTLWRTKAPKKLITMSDMSFKASYDPEIYDSVLEMLNVNQQIIVTFPDDSTLTFWGWLDKFVPGVITEGSQPVADVTIVPSNQNDSGEETAPEYAEA